MVIERDRVIVPEHQQEIAEQIATAKLFGYDGGHACCTDPLYGEAPAEACLDVARRL
ncbi:MAG: hypothetical protein O7F73_00185 [Gammaproteobacteria bacterium]|nr:hypothetical protein [Gammaproteobacteria bacterium]